MAQPPIPISEEAIEDRSSIMGCPLCNASAHRTECFARDELMNRGDRTHHYVRCLSCQTVYLTPLPAPSSSPEIYRLDYPGWSKNWARLFFRYFLIDLPQCWVVERFKKGGTLLDVGSGMGTFLACLRKKGGWVTEGIEPSPFGCELARKRYGLSLWQGTIEEAPFKEHSFDVVTLWEVLEHFENPRSVLRHIFRLLKKDGVILMCLPNIGSIDYPVFKGRWYFLQPPYHLCHFSAQGVRRLLQEEGYTILTFRTTFLSLFESVCCSLQLVLRKGEAVARTPFQKICKIILFLAGILLGVAISIIGTPIFLIAHGFQRGSRMIVVGRKP